jgi:two-component system, NtrC family, response regulator AtoC
MTTSITDETKGRVLIVDDEEDIRELVGQGIELRRFSVATVDSAEAALDLLQSKEFDAVLTDLQMTGMDGLELGKRVIENRSIPVVLLTGKANMDAAIGAVRAGLDDFLQKPVDIDHLALVLERAIERRKLQAEVKRLREEIGESHGRFADMIGESRSMRELQELIARVAPAQVSVLITGESGTGKELVARAIHDRSPRANGPFVAINCAAMPSTLLESELFGHMRGAFTDAVAAKRGLLVQASGGTIFLDEIGDMAVEMQAKLLRSLQEKKVRPVGGNDEISFDARIIAATNRELEEDIEEGRFREDLYYRINVVHLPVPPLRGRGNDILMLAQHFIQRAAKRTGRNVQGLSGAAGQKLMSYDWPGNVRELENCIERAVTLTQFQQLTPDDLPEKVRRYEPTSTEPEDVLGELLSVEELERRHIIRVLKAVDGNKTRASKILGFDRRTLYRKLERYGIST